MHEALTASLDFAFRDLRLHRVMANYRPEHLRSGRLLARLGFAQEGYARDYLFIDGAWRDHILTSRTNPYFDVAWLREWVAAPDQSAVGAATPVGTCPRGWKSMSAQMRSNREKSSPSVGAPRFTTA